MAWLFEFNLGAGFLDYTHSVKAESVLRRLDIHNESLGPTTNQISFLMAPTAAFIASLMAGTSDILVRVTKDGAAYFYGIYQRTLEASELVALEDIQVTVYDPSILLKRKLTAPYKKWASTAVVIVGELLTAGGWTQQSLSSITNAIDSATFEKGGITYFDAIDAILSNFGYVLYFDEAGNAKTFLLFPNAPASSKTYSTGSAGNIIGELKLSRKTRRYAGCKVTFWKHETRANAVVFSDPSGAGQLNKCNIDLTQHANVYPERTGSEDVYCEYSLVENGVSRDLVATNGVTSDILGSGIVVAQFVDYGRKAAVKITGSGTVTRLDVKATSTIIKGSAVVKESIIAGLTDALDEFEASFIQADADADFLVSGRRRYWEFSGTTYSFRTQDTVALGAIATISSTNLDINQLVLITGFQEDDLGFRTVSCEAVSAYALATVSTIRETIPAPNPPAGAPVVVVNDITAPSVPTSVASAQLSNGQLRITFGKSTDTESGMSLYKIYRRENGTTAEACVMDVADTASPTYAVDDSSPVVRKSYQYAVSAVDHRGNESAKSAWTAALAIIDTNAIYRGLRTKAQIAALTNNNVSDYVLCSEAVAIGDATFLEANPIYSVYQWNGTKWSTVGVTSTQIMDSMHDYVAQNPSTGASLSFIQNLATNTALIDRLFANFIQLGGAIYSGGYDAAGNNPLNLPGFFLNSAGGLNAVEALIASIKAIDLQTIVAYKGSWTYGGSFGAPSTSFAGLCPSLLALPDKTVLCFYSGTVLTERIFLPSGVWTEAKPIPGNIPSSISSACRFADGRVLLVYAKPGSMYAYCKIRGTDGSYGPEIKISASTVQSLSVVALSDDTAVLMYQRDSDNYIVEQVRSKDGSWGAPAIVNGAVSGGRGSGTALADGSIVFYYKTYNVAYLAERVRSPAGIWGAETLRLGPGLGDPAATTLPDGRVIVAYTRLSDNFLLFGIRNTNGTFSGGNSLNPSPCGFPSLAVLSDGRVLSLFSQLPNLGIGQCIDNSHFGSVGFKDEYAQVGAGIVEAGENTNGKWILFGDGTAIAWFIGTSFLACTIALAPVYVSAGGHYYYPIEFVGNNPIVVPMPGNGAGYAWIGNVVTYGDHVDIYAVGGRATDTIAPGYIAIGRWK